MAIKPTEKAALIYINLIKTVKSIADNTVGYTRFLFAIKNTTTQTKTTTNLIRLFASTRSPAGKTTTLEIRAAKVDRKEMEG